METALYYTLSTIAQTLAAGFAVLAAFVLYRLQGIELEIHRATYVISGFREYMSPQSIWRTILKEGFPALDARMREIQKERHLATFGTEKLREASERILLWWPIWKTTTFWVRVSLIVTILDIAICFAALPYIPNIATNVTKTWSCLGLTVGLGVLAVVFYSRLILLLISPARLGPPDG